MFVDTSSLKKDDIAFYRGEYRTVACADGNIVVFFIGRDMYSFNVKQIEKILVPRKEDANGL